MTDKINLYPPELFTELSAWDIAQNFLLTIMNDIEQTHLGHDGCQPEPFCRAYRILLEMSMKAEPLMKLLREKFPEHKEALKRYIDTGKIDC